LKRRYIVALYRYLGFLPSRSYTGKPGYIAVAARTLAAFGDAEVDYCFRLWDKISSDAETFAILLATFDRADARFNLRAQQLQVGWCEVNAIPEKQVLRRLGDGDRDPIMQRRK